MQENGCDESPDWPLLLEVCEKLCVPAGDLSSHEHKMCVLGSRDERKLINNVTESSFYMMGVLFITGACLLVPFVML